MVLQGGYKGFLVASNTAICRVRFLFCISEGKLRKWDVNLFY